MSKAYYFCGCLYTFETEADVSDTCPNRSCGGDLMEIL